MFSYHEFLVATDEVESDLYLNSLNQSYDHLHTF